MHIKKKRVTIADIARSAGVSPTAVSLTLADRRDISLSDATRERIRRCADKLGYFPNRLGNGFLRGRSKLIGVLMVVNSYRPFLQLASGINEGLAEADCFPLFMSPDWMERHLQTAFAAPSDGNGAGGAQDLRRLLEYQVDGILYYSSHGQHIADCVRELSGRNIPIVVLGGVEPSAGAVDVVGADNEAIGRMAAEHLLSVGCSSFIVAKPERFHPHDGVMHAGFAARLRKEGRAVTDFILDPEDSGDRGDLCALLSRLGRPPVGVFCTSDTIAALTLRAGFALGWRAPDDFAVACIGDSELARFNALPITTVNRDSFGAGEAAAKLLNRRIEGFDGPPQKILIPPSLEARASSVSGVSWLLQSRRRPAAAGRRERRVKKSRSPENLLDFFNP